MLTITTVQIIHILTLLVVGFWIGVVILFFIRVNTINKLRKIDKLIQIEKDKGSTDDNRFASLVRQQISLLAILEGKVTING